MPASFIICYIFLAFLSTFILCSQSPSQSLYTPKRRSVELVHENPFRENLEKHFSWDDPLLDLELWKGASRPKKKARKRSTELVITYQLRKRVPDPTQPDPNAQLYQSPVCSCPQQGNRGGQFALTDRGYLYSKITLDTTGKSCVFYTQRPVGAQPYSWSDTATNYACADENHKYAIWNMWPRKLDSCTDEENFYCPNAWADGIPRCCWVNVLMDLNAPKQTRATQIYPYFKAMSEAMALSCEGDAYVISDQYQYLRTRRAAGQQRDSIWTVNELKVLQDQGKVKRLFWVQVDNSGAIVQTQDVTDAILNNKNIPGRAISNVTDSEPVTGPVEFSQNKNTSILRKREPCDSAANWQDGYDWFG